MKGDEVGAGQQFALTAQNLKGFGKVMLWLNIGS
jgi:hypothetical protein